MKFRTELPIGIKLPEREDPLKVFSLNDLTVEDLKTIQNPNQKSDHPMVWLGQTLSRVIHEIEGINVSGEYRTQGKIPNIIRAMTLVDVSYALMAGHVYNLGSDLPEFKAVCPACRNHVPFSTDLERDLEVPEIEVEPDATFEVELINGFEYKSKKAAEIGMEGKVWKHYTFRMPTLGDALKNERHWSGRSESTFTERIMADCLTSVQTDDGEEMPDNVRNMIHYNLLYKLSARDMKKIGKEYGNVAPSFRFLTNVECGKCGRGVEVPLEPNFLYSTG